MLKRGLAAIDHPGFEARRKESAAKGKLRGLGFACYGEVCGSNGEETARLAVTDDGGVELWIGTQSNGQGHFTASTHWLADTPRLDPREVALHPGATTTPQSG